MMGPTTSSASSTVALNRGSRLSSEDLGQLREGSAPREPTFRSSPRLPTRAAGDNSRSQGKESIVRWIVLSWYYPERSERMVSHKVSASKVEARQDSAAAAANGASVGAHVSVKLLCEEEDFGSSVSQILTFLGEASRKTTMGPPCPEPDSSNANSSNSAAAALRSMLEGSPSAAELEKRRKAEETEKSEEAAFRAACKAYDEAVVGKAQLVGRDKSQLLSDATRSNNSGRLYQASPLLDGAHMNFGNQLSLARGAHTMNRTAAAGGRPPTAPAGLGRHSLRSSQSMMSLSGVSGRSPALHGLSGTIATPFVAMPMSAGSGPKYGNRTRISPMLLPSNSPPLPPDEFSLGGDYAPSPLLQPQQQTAPSRQNMVASTSTDAITLSGVDILTDSDSPTSILGTPPRYDGSHNSSGSSADVFSYEGNSSSSMSSTGMSRSASGPLYGGLLHGERRVHRRRANPYRPSEIKMLHDAENRGERVPAWRRRWANVHMPDAVHSYETADVASWQGDQCVRWQSITTPAILPLTTKEKMESIEADLVTEDDRGQAKYLSIPNIVTYPPGTYSSAHELLIELVCQRLLHDFQIITPTKSKGPAPTTSWSNDGGSTPRPARWLNPTSSTSKADALPDQNTYLMSKGRYFHRLVASQDGSPSVSITRYVPSKLKYGEPMDYNYEVWHAQEQSFNMRSQTFAAQDYSSVAGLKWDRLDECIASCSIADLVNTHFLSLSEVSTMTKASTKRFAVVPRNPWEAGASPSGQNDSQDLPRVSTQDMPRVASGSSELERGVSAVSHTSTSSTGSGSAAFVTASSYSAWQDRTRASFKAFIRAVDELGKIDAESLAAPVEAGEEGTSDLPKSHRVDIVIKRSGTRQWQDGNAHEWGWATYDQHFNPLQAWRLDICWVSWAGVKVNEFLKRLASRARAHGFLLLEMPVDGNAITGDAGNMLSPAPSSFVCATTFGRRLVEHKLMNQPLTYGFRYDRRLPLTMSSQQFDSSIEVLTDGTKIESSPWSDLRRSTSTLSHQIPALRLRRHLIPIDPHEEDEDAEQLLISARQRLSFALLACTFTVRVSPNPLVIHATSSSPASRPPDALARMVLHGDDSLLQKIAEALPTTINTETKTRARAELTEPGVGFARERRLLHESMPLQFLHESGGALVGSGRSGGSSELNRTVRWIDLTAPGTTSRARVRSNTSWASFLASRAELAKVVEAVNQCAAIVGDVIELTIQVIGTKETKL